MIEEETENTEEEIVETLRLNTHNNILQNNAYTLLSLTKNHATIKVSADTCERVQNSELIYDGVLFSAATFAAIASVNEEKMFVIGSRLDILNPLSGHDDIIFHADANITSSGKKIVKVVGMINDIVFMEGDFTLLKLDEKSLIK